MRKKIPSLRHKTVKKLVAVSLGITSIFGLNSFFYSINEHKLSNAAGQIEAIEALNTTANIDKISIFENLKKQSIYCKKDFPENCQNYFNALIQVKNRSKDYKIALLETIELNENHPIFASIASVSLKADQIASNGFGLSFNNAKKLNIATASEYINRVIENENANINNFNQIESGLSTNLNKLYLAVKSLKERESLGREPIQHLKRKLNISYLILIISEAILFLIVCSVDIINNNISDDSIEGKLNKKNKVLFIVPKVRPLMLSFLFALISVIIGQSLLSYEIDNIVLGHCRKMNLQNIFSYNNLESIPYKNRVAILNLMKSPVYCNKYLSNDSKVSINQLNKYRVSDYKVLHEIQGYKIRLYADSYNRMENSRSQKQSKLLVSLLVFNVLALTFTAIFLQADSKEIEGD